MKQILDKMKKDLQFLIDELKLQAHLCKAEASEGVNMDQLIGKMKSDMLYLRDEFKLQAHLGKAEAQEELKILEKDFDALMTKYKPLADEAGKTAENTGSALMTAAEELMSGMDRLRKLL